MIASKLNSRKHFRLDSIESNIMQGDSLSCRWAVELTFLRFKKKLTVRLAS